MTALEELIGTCILMGIIGFGVIVGSIIIWWLDTRRLRTWEALKEKGGK